MRKATDLFKMQFQIYFKGSTFMMPLIVSAIFLYMMYTVKPQDIISSYVLSGTFLFLLMVWVGLSVSFSEDDITEQLLVLRVQNAGSYYMSKVLFLMCLACFADILYTAFPVIQNLLNEGNLFFRPPTVSDVSNAFLFQGGSAFAGAALGSILHPRVMKNRRLSIVLTVFLAVLSVTADAVSGVLPMLKGILRILPPVMLPAQVYGNAEFFRLDLSGTIFLRLLIYGLAYSILKSVICHRRRF